MSAQNPTAAPTKEQLRKSLRGLIQSIPAEARVTLSQKACNNVAQRFSNSVAKSVLLYVPLQDELDVSSLLKTFLQQGHRVALPRFLPDASKYGAFFIGDKPLQPGAFGVLEPTPDLPVPLNQLDLIIVPGLGFDPRGRRLGRGKGFYDRILSEVSGGKCGICFDEQVVESIPAEPHDVGVDFIATPTRWLVCRGSPPGLR